MLEINKRNSRIWSLLGMRRVFGFMLNEIASEDNNFVFVTSDVARYFGVEKFVSCFPDRYVDVGIAEQNMITVSAGLAKEGKNVFCATYSTFCTARALDQLRVSLAYMNLPVKVFGVGAGLAEGDLSTTHMGLEDVAVTRVLPNMTVIEPSDCAELIKTIYALKDYPHPAYVRLTGKTMLPMIHTEEFDFNIGMASEIVAGGEEIVFISSGVITGEVLKACKNLIVKGYSPSLYSMHTIKPLDYKLLDSLCHVKNIFVVQQHMKAGGLGSAILEYYADKSSPFIRIIGLNDSYPRANDYSELIKETRLDASSIEEYVLSII